MMIEHGWQHILLYLGFHYCIMCLDSGPQKVRIGRKSTTQRKVNEQDMQQAWIWRSAFPHTASPNILGSAPTATVHVLSAFVGKGHGQKRWPRAVAKCHGQGPYPRAVAQSHRKRPWLPRGSCRRPRPRAMARDGTGRGPRPWPWVVAKSHGRGGYSQEAMAHCCDRDQ